MNSTVYAVDEYGNEAADVRSGYIGEFKKFGFSGVPKHCLACDGSEISRATYSELFEVFGETYGAGDGETTFNLPDFRGAFLRCIGGNASALGTKQSDTIRNIEGGFTIRSGNGASGLVSVFVNGAFSSEINSNNAGTYTENATRQAQTDIVFSAEKCVPTSNENRPINYAVNVCVVYE